MPSSPVGAQVKNPHVVLHTQLGDIELELDVIHAPVTATNFLRYVNGGFFTGGTFYRTVTMQNQPDNPVKIEVVEAGINPARKKEGFPPIVLERTNKTGLHHVDGELSMGRWGPDTAASDFSICIGNQPEMDFGGKRNPDGQGFAAFGHVVHGMDVARKIQAQPSEGQKLTPPIKILGAEVIPGR